MGDDLGAIDEDVDFNAAAAELLSTRCTSAASAIQGQAGSRTTWSNDALTDFQGHFSDVFRSNAGVQRADAELLVERLREVAQGATRLKEEAAKEQQRRQTARDWKRRHDNRGFWDQAHDLVFGEEKPPVGPPADPSLITVQTPPSGGRETPPPGSGGGSGGTSSARPDHLRTFATNSGGANDSLKSWPGQLRDAYADFTAKCHFGSMDASGVWVGFDKYLEANGKDVEWANTVAAAFEAAGGSGGITTLSNTAIAAALQSAGVNSSRTALTIDPPTAFGGKTTTGYADDPVNTFTGNFLEVEVDLGFAGGCSTLEFSRTYNSLNPEAGGFGPGWSSWTEAGLLFSDDLARWVHPDGRHVIFPRLGAGWDRATEENFWLTPGADDELVVSDNSGGRWRFTSAGRLLGFDRGAGTAVTAHYSEGRLTRLAHERGRWVSIDWEGDRVVAVRASDDRRFTFDYDTNGQLLRACGPQGERAYRWNEAGLIAAVIDSDSVVEADNVFDGAGRVVSQTSAFGRTTRYAYLPGGATVVSDTDGSRSTTWIADAKGRLTALVDAEERRQSMAYDRWGNLVSVTERDGAVTLSAYDERGHRIRQITPSGADLQWGYDEADRVTTVIAEEGAATTYTYTGDSRNPSTMVDPTGGVTAFEWVDGLLVGVRDPAGVTVRFSYDEHGDLVAIIDAEGNAARLERDAAGRVTDAITPLGHRTTYTYDARGSLKTRRDPDGGIWRFEHTAAGRLLTVTDPMGARTEIEYGLHGQESRRIDPLGRAVTRVVDDLGNLASLELPDGSAWRFSHDALSRLVSTTDPNGGVWRNEFDANGRLTDRTDPTGARLSTRYDIKQGTLRIDDGSAEELLRFDPLGRPISGLDVTGAAELASYDHCGRPIELVDADGGLTRIERDPAGKVVHVTTPTGLETHYAWDACGRLAAITDPAGATTTYHYDADGHLVRVTAPTGEVNRYSYDAMGRLVSAEEPGRGVTRRAYDRAGRLVRTYDTWNGHRRYRYDSAGQLVEAINGVGGVTTFSHDELGRVTTVTSPDGGQSHRVWDEAGRLVSLTDALGRVSQAGYDGAGRQTWQVDPDGRRTEWTFDSAGRQQSLVVDGRLVSTTERDLRNQTVRIHDHTDPNGRVLSYEWDRRGNMTRRTCDQGTLTWSYDAEGRRVSMTGSDGHTTRYDWDSAGRLTEVDHPLFGRAGFVYDAAGRLVQASTGDSIRSWRYADGWLASQSVTDAQGTSTVEFVRDEDGRIVEIGADGVATTYAYDEAAQLIEAGATRWVYDGCGRLVTESTGEHVVSHTHDLAGQLVTSTGPDGTTRYSYDAVGRRVGQTRPDGSGRAFEWGPTGWLSGVSERSTQGERFTPIRVDAEGQLCAIGDSAVVWDVALPIPALARVGEASVLAAGALTGVDGRWLSAGWRDGRSTSAANPWLPAEALRVAAGVDLTPSAGLLIGGLEWLDARVYDASTHGFLSVDPLPPTVGAGWAGNPYAYAGNNPLGLLDPTGLHPVTDADLAAYAAAHGGALAAASDWVSNNWEYLAGGAMVIAGGVLVATGAGGPVGMMLISAGADTIIQKATTGKVDWGEVALSGALGAVGGGAASLAKGASTAGVSALRTTVLVNGGVGAIGSEAMYIYRNHDNLTWNGALGAGVGGFIGGAVAGAAGPAGGSIARSMGQTSTGAAAFTATTMLNAVGGGAGNLANQLIATPGQGVDWRAVGGSAGFAGVSSAGTTGAQKLLTSVSPSASQAVFGSARGTNTLSQLSNFGPRTMSGAMNFSATNTSAMWKSTGMGALVGAFGP